MKYANFPHKKLPAYWPSAFHNILEKCKWNIRGVRGTIKVDGG